MVRDYRYQEYAKVFELEKSFWTRYERTQGEKRKDAWRFMHALMRRSRNSRTKTGYTAVKDLCVRGDAWKPMSSKGALHHPIITRGPSWRLFKGVPR